MFWNVFTCFKLGYTEKQPVPVYDRQRAKRDFDDRHIPYHIEFFRCGLNAIIRMWLAGGCRETPEEMAQILADEYSDRRPAEQKSSAPFRMRSFFICKFRTAKPRQTAAPQGRPGSSP